MALNRSKLDRIYEDYGFRAAEVGSNVRAYTIQNGPFYNAEVVRLGDDDQGVAAAKKQYESSGYSVQVRRFVSEAAAADHLFNSYFNLADSRRGLTARIETFQKTQSALLGFDYEYVPVPFDLTRGPARAGESVQEALLRLCQQKSATLVLIEAAAGFGKTCTLVELLRRWMAADGTILPIYAELSRNRTARIFRYVLLDEIDQSLHLSSELVKRQIAEGRVPLFLDGFDELLSRDRSAEGSSFAEAEPMLETIAGMLTRHAKVVISTRRTAVFEDEEFEEWVRRLGPNCSFCRVQLNPPRLVDWVGQERLQSIARSGFPVSQFSNPVLLSYLRKLHDREFQDALVAPEKIVDRYLDALLHRERERQDLRMDVADQLTLLTEVARGLLDADITRDTREKIREFLLSTPRNIAILSDCERRYSGAERVTRDEIVDKVLVHALLDRSPGRSLFGFINDTVLGTLQGDAILDSPEKERLLSDGQVDRVVSAYRLRGVERRRGLWDKLRFLRDLSPPAARLRIDVSLLRYPSSDISAATYDGAVFEGVHFGSEGSPLEFVTFVNCTFRGCRFFLAGLTTLGFADCRFFECTVVGRAPSVSDTWTARCEADDPNLEPRITARREPAGPTQAEELDPAEFDRQILEQYWPPGRAAFVSILQERTLFRGSRAQDHRSLVAAVDRLCRGGLLRRRQHSVELVVDRISEISSLLGRRLGDSNGRT